MKKLLAVSGGVDSSFLLWQFRDDSEVLVAHFNHGARASANDDQKFVQDLVKRYGKPFLAESAQLGEGVSEDAARAARYDFLRRAAQENDAVIYTAHHVDDLVETVALNLARGTGWRGLAPFAAADVRRPLLEQGLLKEDLLRGAAENHLVFREDPTNHENNYTRNRVREKLQNFAREDKLKILELYRRQVRLRTEIEKLLNELLPEDGVFERAWFATENDEVLLEFLKVGVQKFMKLNLTRPQLVNFLAAIRNYAPEKTFNLPEDQLVVLHKTYFRLGD